MIGKIGTFTLITVMTTTCSMAQSHRKGRQEEDPGPGTTKTNYGANIITVAPFTAMDYGVGFGLSYERIFGSEGRLGLVLPLSLMLEGKNAPGYQYQSDKHNTYFYFTPGLKIYPFGQRKVTYAVGPTLMLSYGSNESNWYRGYPVDGTRVTWLRMGVMVSNYVNFQLSRSFSLGLEMGLGVRYYDRQTYTEPGMETPFEMKGSVKPTGRFALTLGFRF